MLAAVAASDAATALRLSRWLYAAVNATHIFGIALLVGAILPLDLRLLGFWAAIERTALVRVLVPVAAFGIGLAAVTGALLFATRAPEYAQLDVFRVKIALIVLGAVSALSLHLAHGFVLEGATPGRLRRAAALSMMCWIGALVAGRMIAFTGD